MRIFWMHFLKTGTSAQWWQVMCKYATMGAMQLRENQDKTEAQMFSIIRRRPWFYTSPVSVCQLGAAPVVYMCMTKMNHQMVLAKFQHHFWTPCPCQFAGLLECWYCLQKGIKWIRVARFAVLVFGFFFFYSSVVKFCFWILHEDIG